MWVTLQFQLPYSLLQHATFNTDSYVNNEDDADERVKIGTSFQKFCTLCLHGQ